MNQNYGGNLVASHSLESFSRHTFALTPYLYFHLRLKAGETVKLPTEKGVYSVFVFAAHGGASVRFDALSHPVQAREAVQLVHQSAGVTAEGGDVELLVAGAPEADAQASETRHFKASEIKKVSKPWGHELWFHGGHPQYAFKEIFVKAGTKTSLQYHRHKQETNILFAGDAVLHYKSDPNASIDAPSLESMATLPLTPVSSVDVTPFVLHRLEAVTDILLYEVSTPFLDDVVRVSDDTARPDGHIETEHSS
jgi:mannose-6-phosphate isomerase